MMETMTAWLGFGWGILVIIALTDILTLPIRQSNMSRKSRHTRVMRWLGVLTASFALMMVVILIVVGFITFRELSG